MARIVAFGKANCLRCICVATHAVVNKWGILDGIYCEDCAESRKNFLDSYEGIYCEDCAESRKNFLDSYERALEPKREPAP